ncbi:peptidylprolyl isomerase [Acetobacter orientalis]|uniref:Peptidyl-prolyl cis-trans isomerase n=1 Tax=Acetobacter orientalis TaxID=146474 RepID=A0A252C544_9PROT|nr:FKBP-type peptidyl-prolyl cis-trans isomerase [Acetobacter orientalis]MDN6041027.1 FKBP-type peptidyl-prolyl cis-trans isomerase [Acetobacter sp.]MCP1216505.1 FKBP-type peptidyl-prolyl cis-trans isomerase [Acetobacter orientalis]MCP1219739.1 FKBP-type peptidyl-prolyl cis-trans isomerase [Acetobacter orientalis]MCP1222592.1 FKBP-type peptidyl-prolyl cis-trans isomerase [Acetobacter orientalis]OUI85213.1 peptidylprolyl isomerase [Acetobacter orientalis]
MTRRFKLTHFVLAASMAASLAACGAHKDEDVELTPQQQMAKLRAEPGVVTLKDGLAYKVIASGPKDGPQPRVGDMMMVIYEGRLPDGSIFDSSEQHGDGAYMQMPLQGLVQGWMEAMPMMHVGDTWMLYVPPELGYGHKAMGVIPADSPLIFRIQILGVDHAH